MSDQYLTRELDNRRDISAVALALLRRAGVGERLPTPVADLVAASGLLEAADYVFSEANILKAPRTLRGYLRGVGRKIRGALDRRERVLHVSPSVSVAGQRQFIRCHELMHDAIPWQRELLVLGDTDLTLAPDIELRFEREANHGAAELLFQLDLLDRVARDYRTDITTPIVLAEMFGASIHATFRRWVERHPGTACMLTLDSKPMTQTPVTYRRREHVESAQWRALFGPTRLHRQLNPFSHPFILQLGQFGGGTVDTAWQLTDLDEGVHPLRVQSFSNSYRTFVLLWEPAKETFVARHRKPSRLATIEIP